MPMPEKPTTEEAKEGALHYIRAWGESSLAPTALATLITAQHLRPLQKLPMVFPPVLLFSSYLNLNGYPVDAAGISSAWSAAYLVVARRRHQSLRNKFTVRGVVRGATLGLCIANVLGGGLTYFFAKKGEEV